MVVVSLSPRRLPTAEINGVRVHYLELKNLYWAFGRDNPPILKPLWHAIDTYNPFAGRELGRLLDQERPSLVHTHNVAGFSVAVWSQVKARHIPLVHHLNDYYLICPRSMFKTQNNCERVCRTCSAYGLPRRRMSNLVDAALALSQFVLRRHEAFGYFSRTPIRQVVYPGYRRRSVPCVDSGSPRDVNPKRVSIGYLGRLHPSKGVESVLHALSRLPSERWEMRIAGKGAPRYEAHLKERFALPNVTYLGLVEPEELLTKIDVLVVPSLWHEPFGMVTIEAYAHGVPVIGSRRGGLTEIIKPSETGFLFDPDSSEDLEKTLRQLLWAPSLLAGMRAKALSEAQQFLPQLMIDQCLGVYERLVQSSEISPK